MTAERPPEAAAAAPDEPARPVPGTYTAKQVVNAFLFLAANRRRKLAHLALQKLLFFAHAWSLAIHGRSVVDECPQAWPHGPVFASVYHELKFLGNNTCLPLTEYDPHQDDLCALQPAPEDTVFWNLLTQVWDRYGGFTPLQLSALAHSPGGPWAQARATRALDIEDELLIQHFRAKLLAQLPEHETATAT